MLKKHLNKGRAELSMTRDIQSQSLRSEIGGLFRGLSNLSLFGCFSSVPSQWTLYPMTNSFWFNKEFGKFSLISRCITTGWYNWFIVFWMFEISSSVGVRVISILLNVILHMQMKFCLRNLEWKYFKICKAFNPTNYFGNKRIFPPAFVLFAQNYICLT